MYFHQIKVKKNKYTEYAYIKQTDGRYDWEKMGEFLATPNLSNYVQSNSSPTFRQVTCNSIVARTPGKGTPVFGQKGGSIDVGSEESFVFTLEDGSKVTKSIRVISTTNS